MKIELDNAKAESWLNAVCKHGSIELGNPIARQIDHQWLVNLVYEHLDTRIKVVPGRFFKFKLGGVAFVCSVDDRLMFIVREGFAFEARTRFSFRHSDNTLDSKMWRIATGFDDDTVW